MPKKFSFFVGFSFLLCSQSGFSEVITLTKAMEVAQSTSPDIQQLEEQHLSNRAKARLALAPSEPTISLSENDLTQQFVGSTSASEFIQVTQTLGFPGRALLNRAMLSDQADATSYQVEAMKLQVNVNVKTAYYNLQLARKNIELNTDTRLAYENIMSIAKRRYEAGATAQVDYINAQVALLQNHNDLSDLETAERQARAQLNILLKRPVDSALEIDPIRMTYFPKIDLNQAIDKMVANRKEIKAAQSQERSANKAHDLAWMSLLPDFQLTAGMTNYREPAASPYNSAAPWNGTGYPTHTYQVGVQITIPLWGLLNEREVVIGAAHDHAAAEKNLAIVYNQSKTAIETTVDTINSTAQKIENFEKHMLPLSEQSLNLALIAYSSGKVDFQTLSDTATARRQTRLNYATAVVSYLTNYATYGQLIGEEIQ